MDKMFDYQKVKLESVPCGLCGGNNFFILARRAANGVSARTCMCGNCGLIYINPRMTKQGYDDYYKYFYRRDRAASKGEIGKPDDIQANFNGAKRFGNALGRRLTEYIGGEGLALDVGSSTGGVLCGLKEIFPKLELLGVEPSIAESEFANQRGIKTHNCLFEDFLKINNPFGFSVILCVRSLNHLLAPKLFFEWCHNNLENGGCLILEVKNFRHQVRRAGSIEAGVQIDHPYMFTPEVLREFVESAGFQVIYSDNDEYKSKSEALRQKEEGLSVHHIRLAAKKIPDFVRPALRKWRVGKSRLQLSRPYLKFYYAIFYHRRLGWLRKIMPVLSRN